MINKNKREEIGGRVPRKKYFKLNKLLGKSLVKVNKYEININKTVTATGKTKCKGVYSSRQAEGVKESGSKQEKQANQKKGQL